MSLPPTYSLVPSCTLKAATPRVSWSEVFSIRKTTVVAVPIATVTFGRERRLEGAALFALTRGAVSVVFSEKQQIIKKSGLLEYCATSDTFALVGGLAALR